MERRDFLPARKGAKLRVLDVRHGKGDRQRRVRLSGAATRAIVRWERERTRALGAGRRAAIGCITLGHRRRATAPTPAPAGAAARRSSAAVIKRLGAAAELPDELRHPHALRHTCATELLRAGATIADVRVLLGHASVKATSIYPSSGGERQEHVVQTARARPTATPHTCPAAGPGTRAVRVHGDHPPVPDRLRRNLKPGRQRTLRLVTEAEATVDDRLAELAAEELRLLRRRRRRAPARRARRPRRQAVPRAPATAHVDGRARSPASVRGRLISRLSYPRRQQLRRLGRAAAIAAGALAATVGAVAAALAGLAAIAVGLLLVAAALAVRARHWRRLAVRSGVGARSEADVQRALAALEREGWRLRHSLAWHRGDIDHVAIAPTGVAFAIETKTRRYEPRHLQTVRDQAAWFQRRRRRWCPRGAFPVLCVTRARGLQAGELDVLVVSLDHLLPALRAAAGTTPRPAFLAPEAPMARR